MLSFVEGQLKINKNQRLGDFPNGSVLLPTAIGLTWIHNLAFEKRTSCHVPCESPFLLHAHLQMNCRANLSQVEVCLYMQHRDKGPFLSMCFRSPLTALRNAHVMFLRRLRAVTESSSQLVRHAVVMKYSVLQGTQARWNTQQTCRALLHRGPEKGRAAQGWLGPSTSAPELRPGLGLMRPVAGLRAAAEGVVQHGTKY